MDTKQWILEFKDELLKELNSLYETDSNTTNPLTSCKTMSQIEVLKHILIDYLKPICDDIESEDKK